MPNLRGWVFFLCFVSPLLLKSQSNLPPSLSKGLVMHFSFSAQNRQGTQIRADNNPNLKGAFEGSADISSKTMFGDALMIGGSKKPGRLKIPYASHLALKPPFTLSFWAKLNHFSPQDNFTPNKGGIHAVYAHAEHGRGFWTRLDGLGRDFRFIASNDTKVNKEPTSSFELFMPFLKPNVPFHYVVRVEPAEGNKSRYQVFINGLPREQFPNIFTSEGPNNFEDYQLPISIGAFGEKMDWAIDGAIDEVRLYNRPISNTEVLLLANRHESQGTPPFAEVWKPEAVFWGVILGLVGMGGLSTWWHFWTKRTVKHAQEKEIREINTQHDLIRKEEQIKTDQALLSVKSAFQQEILDFKSALQEAHKSLDSKNAEVFRLNEEVFRLNSLIATLRGTPLSSEEWEAWAADKLKLVPFAEAPPTLQPSTTNDPIGLLFFLISEKLHQIQSGKSEEPITRERKFWTMATELSIDQWRTVLTNAEKSDDMRVTGISGLGILVTHIIRGCFFRYLVYCDSLPNNELIAKLFGMSAASARKEIAGICDLFKVKDLQELFNACNQQYVKKLVEKQKK
ncbi:MAG: hypothetical protein JNN12_00430 [Bacteroidetes Order II. Incertae sedis bacterium]|nr:hypothetical protein [Bacteroidetes Order II. bacterium]